MIADKKMEPPTSSMLGLLARASKGLLAFSIVCGIISGASSMGLIYLINDALHDGGTKEGYRIWLFVGSLLVVTISGLASQIFLIRLGQNSMLKMRMLLIRRILVTPLNKLEEIGSSRLYATLTDDVHSLVDAAQVLPHLAVNAGVLIGAFIYLGWLSPAILLISIAFVVVGIMIFQGLVGNAMRHFESAREINDSLFEHFRAVTFGVKELKLNKLKRHAFLTDELEVAGRSYQGSNVRGLTTYAIASQWGQLLFFIVIGWLIFFRSTSNSLDDATLVGSVLTVIFVMGPLGAILDILPILGRADIAAKKIDSLQLDYVDDIHLPLFVSSNKSQVTLTDIELVQSTYSYPGETREEFKLGPVDLMLRPSEVVFLVGGNGSGKSTLLKILTGLYVPENGEIRINGKCVVGENDRESYRQFFSAVFADFHLFEQLPKENGEFTDDMALKHLELLQLNEKVNVKNGRFSTILLSQGQKKRLALLCAFLEDRPVYVFDEWAADQDPIFRDIFYMQIIPDLKRRGKAVLAVTHDERYFHLADRVVKLDSGMLIS